MSLCLYSKSEISYGERTIKAAEWRDKLRIWEDLGRKRRLIWKIFNFSVIWPHRNDTRIIFVRKTQKLLQHHG